MARVEIRIATVIDAWELAQNMRPEDAAECMASGGYNPVDAIMASMQASNFTSAVLFDGQVAALFGVVELAPMTVISNPRGVVWALTSTVVDRHRKTFFKVSRQVLDELSSQYSRLVNSVDARYVGALRLLSRLGFEIHPAEPFGVEGRPFHFVSYRRS